MTDLQPWLDEVEKRAEFDSVAAASACEEDQETILKCVKLLRAAEKLAEVARTVLLQPEGTELGDALAAYDAARKEVTT